MRSAARDDMNRCYWVLPAIAILGALAYVLGFGAYEERRVKRERQELHALENLKIGVQNYVSAGGRCPTNWQVLSNVSTWPQVSSILSYSSLPSLPELYTLLEKPVPFDESGWIGYVFLVRSKPIRGGRWALKLGHQRAPSPIYLSDSNVVLSIGIGERELPEEIRVQLKAAKHRAR